jgi:hypothetical protein
MTAATAGLLGFAFVGTPIPRGFAAGLIIGSAGAVITAFAARRSLVASRRIIIISLIALFAVFGAAVAVQVEVPLSPPALGGAVIVLMFALALLPPGRV